MSLVTRHLKLLAIALVAVLALAACGGDDAAGDGATGDGEAAISASDLRSTLTLLLQEHVFFAASATNEALQGRTAEFEGAAGALDDNSVALAGAIGLVYGADAEQAFLGLWRSHIDMFVDYTQAVATGDQARADAAVADLTGYANDFAVFLNGANENLPVPVVEALVIDHVLTTKSVVDGQAAGDVNGSFLALRDAISHMHAIADPLAGAISAQNPDLVPGPADSPASDLQQTLNELLAEHTWLAGAATNGALKGNEAEFGAAAAALDGNSQDFAAAIGSVYGAEAGEAFLGLWRSHIDMFVDYTQGVAGGDQARADAAVNDLTGYATDFAVFLNGATGIDTDAAEGLVVEHALTLKSAIDQQAAGNFAGAFRELRAAGQHMSMIANPLAATIAEQQGL